MKKVLPARQRFKHTFAQWPVPGEWCDELHRYVVLGFPPGGFHTAVYANDLIGAVHRTHVLNTWDAIVAMCKWLEHVAPRECFGSYEKVNAWLALSKDERRIICEKKGIIATEQEIMWETLSNISKPSLSSDVDYPF